MIDKNSSIGVFDSGLGGLSVLKVIKELLPNEDIIYFGDSNNAPYGVKSLEEVVNLTRNAFDFLMSKEVKAVVLACNTATSAAVDILRKSYDSIIIGMEPALKTAVVNNTIGDIVVMATPMTLREKKFDKLMSGYSNEYSIIKLPTPKIVEYVENNSIDCDFKDLLNDYFGIYDLSKIESIVLGCTHFVFVKDEIDRYFKSNVKLYDGNQGTVVHLKRQLASRKLLKEDGAEGLVTVYNTSKSSKEGIIRRLIPGIDFRYISI